MCKLHIFYSFNFCEGYVLLYIMASEGKRFLRLLSQGFDRVHN